MKKEDKHILGLKIISVIFFISAFMFIVSALTFVPILGEIFPQNFSVFTTTLSPSLLTALFAFLFIIPFPFTLPILPLGFGLLYFFVGKGLWNQKRWARITAIILAVVGIFMAWRIPADIYYTSMIGTIKSVTEAIINLGIIIYLIFWWKK